MTDLAAWPAPAKLNLMLRIVGRRTDGYHLLQTVFQFIDLYDQLYFDIRPDGKVRRVGKLDGVLSDDDLTVRAARLLQNVTGCDAGVDIHLGKRIPMGGGLGGGSSDAATTLVALNRLWGCGLSESELIGLGRQLGADVPIFVHGHAAWAEGVGDEFSDCEPPTPYYFLLAPAAKVDTGKVFQEPELTRNSRRITIRDFLAGERGNDCLSVVRERYPEVARALDWLSERGDARLTGTGACIFASCAGRDEAEALLEQDPPGNAWVVKGTNRSPLLDSLRGE